MRHAAERIALGMLTLAWPAAAQIGAFEWTLAGNPGGSGFATPTSLHVVGPDNSTCKPPVTWFETVLPVGGTIHVLLDFQNLDSWVYKGHADFDAPAWVIDSLYELPPPAGVPGVWGWPTGTYEMEFEAEAGQRIGLGAWALDCGYGPGVADYHDLVLVPKPWSTHFAALDPRALWKAPQSVAFSGMIMEAAGDVDLDGIADLVLSGFFTDATTIHILAGADGATLLATKDAYSSVDDIAGVGDVNGDGVSDVAAGHSNASGALLHVGTVTVLSGVDGALLLQAWGSVTNDKLGERVAGVGDVDLDGVPDLAVQLEKGSSSKSEVRVISGATGAVLHAFQPIQQTNDFGDGLAGPGDLTGDGVPDVLVGTPHLDAGVSLFSGASGFLAKTFLNPGVTNLGSVVAAIGDVDGGGTVDFVASASGTFVVFSAESAAPIVMLTDPGASAYFGGVVAGGFDVNGDDRLDLVAGVSSEAPGGAIGVFDALDGSLLAVLAEQQPKQSLGKGVAMPGDLDGDGLGDIAGLSTPYESFLPPSVRTWSQLAHAGPPTLAHSGDPLPGQLITVTIAKALPGAPGFLVVGGALVDLPIAGGVLAASADLVIPVVADLAGGAQVTARWPDGLAVWTSLWMQAWMHDPAGPTGFSASDALAASQL